MPVLLSCQGKFRGDPKLGKEVLKLYACFICHLNVKIMQKFIVIIWMTLQIDNNNGKSYSDVIQLFMVSFF